MSAVQSNLQSIVVAVAGNPNCGKTTIFNALTGLRHKVGNYPGVTVEKKFGSVLDDPTIQLLDLPGTYSLSARSPDEEISREVLLGNRTDTPRPDAVLVVVDASNLERNLFLATQIIELGLPVVIACNMMDRVEADGHRLDLAKLSERLGVPIFRSVGFRKEGLSEIRSALKQLQLAGSPANPGRRQWSLPEPIEQEIGALATCLVSESYADDTAADGAAVLLLSEGDAPDKHLPANVRTALAGVLQRLSERADNDPAMEITAARYAWLGEIVDACLTRSKEQRASNSDRLDAVLTHRVWGTLAFAGMMAAMFFSIFWLADPIMGWVEGLFTLLQDGVKAVMPDGVLQDLLTEGVIAGVGNVVVFFPQICILFLFIALLEDSGYMARAAFLMDRVMNRVGLHGKSFIPLLSSHACAIPGIMAARTIENPRDRLATILVAPLMSCSARLPVYTVLIAACLPVSAILKTGIMSGMYVLGIVAALTMATLFKKTILKGPTPAFIMELPPYRVPRLSAALRVMWDRSKLFLKRASTVILAITIVLWALLSYPKEEKITAMYDAMRTTVQQEAAPDLEERLEELDNLEAADNLANSYAGRLGHYIEPVIKPLGYDWKIGIGVIASIAAREVFVGTMGVVYSVGEVDEESEPLREQMREQRWPDGSKVYTPLTGISLMVFYVLACQCISTIAVVRRETNGWGWPTFMFVYMTVLAYVASLIIYQLGQLLGFGGA